MLRRTRGRFAAVVVAVAVVMVIGVVLVVQRSARPGSEADRPEEPVSPASSASPSPASPRPSARPTKPRTPPAGSLRLPARYLAGYGAHRVSWDDVVRRGKRLPAVSARCAERWRTSGKDPRVNWKSVEFLCLDALDGSGFRPQGIAGSATTRGYSIGPVPAVSRNLVLTSWYSRRQVPGLFAANRAGESVTRLVVIDLDRRRYNTVELVKPDGRTKLRNLNSHGSGLAWAGQYLYSSSHSKLWMYNADDLVEISGRFVLPAVARWTVHGRGGLSSISLDRSTTPHQLRGINYSRKGRSYIAGFDLERSGLLSRTSGSTSTTSGLQLRNHFGENGRVVQSARSVRVRGTNYQGVAGAGRYTFANSSGLRTRHRPGERVDAATVLKDGKVLDAVLMPGGNGESIYLDYRRGLYLSLVEHGSQFLFAIPLQRIIEAAER